MIIYIWTNLISIVWTHTWGITLYVLYYCYLGIPTHPAGAFIRQYGNITSYYTFHGSKSTWYDAVKTCKEENVHSNLATVTDATEQQYLVNRITSDVGKCSICMVFNNNHCLWRMIIVLPYPFSIAVSYIYSNFHVLRYYHIADNILRFKF